MCVALFTVTLTRIYNAGANSFNQPLSSWGAKTASVTSFSYMFEGATSYDQDVSSWDVFSANVGLTGNHEASSPDFSDNGFYRMFKGAAAFKHDPSPAWSLSNPAAFAGIRTDTTTSFVGPVDVWTATGVDTFTDTCLKSADPSCINTPLTCRDSTGLLGPAVACPGGTSKPLYTVCTNCVDDGTDCCTPNTCTCADGVEATGADCTSDGLAKCVSCAATFFLDGVSCSPHDTCLDPARQPADELVAEAGTPTQDAVCETNEACVEGSIGDGTPSPAAVEYTFDYTSKDRAIKAFAGDTVTFTWADSGGTEHNVKQYVDLDLYTACNSAGGTNIADAPVASGSVSFAIPTDAAPDTVYYIADNEGAGSICSAGMKTTITVLAFCTTCPASTKASMGVCAPCSSPGEYSAAGSTECAVASAGNKPSEDRSQQVQCDPGTFSAGGVDECTPAGHNKYVREPPTRATHTHLCPLHRPTPPLCSHPTSPHPSSLFTRVCASHTREPHTHTPLARRPTHPSSLFTRVSLTGTQTVTDRPRSTAPRARTASAAPPLAPFTCARATTGWRPLAVSARPTGWPSASVAWATSSSRTAAARGTPSALMGST